MELPGADRQWVPKVELPRGGGAIRPVGEKVEAQAFNGSASYSIALPVSPGRDGRAPGLSLTYSSGGGNGPFVLGQDGVVTLVGTPIEGTYDLCFGAQFLNAIWLDQYGDRVIVTP